MTEGAAILISTHDLPRAGELRQGFSDAGYETELVTPKERLSGYDDAALLLFTGDATAVDEAIVEQAREALHIPVFAFGESASTAAQRAIFEEVFPPSATVEDIVLLGRRAAERRRLRRVTGIVGQTDAMREVLERVVQIAPVASTVLVTGESGTGKELVARGIHHLSGRRHKPFIAVNVAALSETLLESELFGHEKGAFTGAIDTRKGLFELANGGTIFLDEIGEMPLQTQTKLLRVLEQREFHRVGGEKPIIVDVRIVTATNQDLRQLVAIGDFRRDLYFRLNVLSIQLPPLRERRADIPLLIEAFVKDVSDRNDLEFPGISPEALEILIDYSWPGNIRELRNLVESMVVLAPGRQIRPEDIPDDVRGRDGTSLLPVAMPRSGGGGRKHAEEGRTLRPELEFIFRTLVELKVDVDDLRREFEEYRSLLGEDPGRLPIVGRVGVDQGAEISGGIEISPYSPGMVAAEEELSDDVLEEDDDDGVVVFRPGMTIEDMEREAIAAALYEVGGNRRKAAERLGIGERTLYRKISKYELEA
ncbi:MAG: sigma-54-dependent Fis family transcriptional regulator [Gemmatimonadetes bacterium]|nr:sigma-54-dependent Fis family transcriptional regulator [Gemmatimonadota bacterium]